MKFPTIHATMFLINFKIIFYTGIKKSLMKNNFPSNDHGNE